MPIVDVQLFEGADSQGSEVAASLANSLAGVFHAAPGRVWVRLARLPPSAYAENGNSEPAAERPVFVSVLHADLPPPQALAVEAKAIAQAVAGCLGRSSKQVHVEYSPPGRGRVAFGGNLLS
jgi:phenylpyruvate tautomerase PptA (4-oxalocrotonate tautomerase family)